MNAAAIRQELQRVRRGFSEEKLRIIHEQAERNTELEALSRRLRNTMSELSIRIENHTDGTMKQINDFVHEVEAKMNVLLNAIDRGVDSTLKTMLDIVEKSVGEMNNGIQSHVYTPIAERDQLFDVTGCKIREHVLKTQDGCNRENFVDELVKTYGLINLLDVFNIPLSESYYKIGSHSVRLIGHYDFEYGKIRLANFSTCSFNSAECDGSGGRVEVYYDGEWGTVCDDEFDDIDATVICGMIGYKKGKAKTNAKFGLGTGLIWLDELGCFGNETSIFDCQGSDIGNHDCSHVEDAGVICSNE